MRGTFENLQPSSYWPRRPYRARALPGDWQGEDLNSYPSVAHRNAPVPLAGLTMTARTIELTVIGVRIDWTRTETYLLWFLSKANHPGTWIADRQPRFRQESRILSVVLNERCENAVDA